MVRHYYGTITVAAWILGHYFYGSRHYVYVAGEYFPYRLNNPKSSNPHLIYQDLYQPWRDKDDYDRFLNGYRLSLIRGVLKKLNEGVIDNATADRLKRLCDYLDIVFFYPVVCKIDAARINPNRLKVEGSGTRGSSEFVITDLEEPEIDELLFLDFDEDQEFNRVVMDEYVFFRSKGNYLNNSGEVLAILEGRCRATGVSVPAT